MRIVLDVPKGMDATWALRDIKEWLHVMQSDYTLLGITQGAKDMKQMADSARVESDV